MFQLNLAVSKTIVWLLFVFLECDEKMVNVVSEDAAGVKRGAAGFVNVPPVDLVVVFRDKIHHLFIRLS